MSGLGIYTRNLLVGLASVAGDRNIIACVLPEARSLIPSLPRLELNYVSRPVEDHVRGDWWKQITLPALLKKRQVDVYHEPAYQLPIRPVASKLVVTVHDLSPFVHPETNTRKYNLYWRAVTRSAIRKAHAIIVPSEFVRQEVSDRFPDAGDRLVVVPSPVSTAFSPGSVDVSILERYGVRRPFILTAAKYEPRKNLSVLLQALPSIRRRLGDDMRLVAAGESPVAFRSIRDLIRRSGITDAVRFTGYIPEPHLVALVRSAAVVVVPSLYEGFGYPVAEALACGTPVAAARKASLPEVGGDLAEYFDPERPESVAEIVSLMLEDEDLRRRVRLEGPSWVAQFRPEPVASRLLQIYADVARNRFR
jgi:glycosyltransferase involved in cell wall biosynthesis